MGLINREVAPDNLTNFVDDYCQRIARNAPLTMLAAKRIVDEVVSSRADLDEAMCERLVEECFASEDYIEGRSAFMEKRKPVFNGR